MKRKDVLDKGPDLTDAEPILRNQDGKEISGSEEVPTQSQAEALTATQGPDNSVTDAPEEAKLIIALQQLLSSKAAAGMMARAITEFQLQAHRGYKQKMHRRRLNEKETFICISLGAANFVNHLKEMKI